MEDVAGWVALIATTIAAVMTAANLGSRVTGWGFVIFSVGAVAWMVVGATGGQQTLLLSNAFLLVVDIAGVWRWLGRRAKFDDAAARAEAVSGTGQAPNLFRVSKIDGMAVTDRAGETVAHAVDAMTECGGGKIDYLIVRMGGVAGVGEELRCLPWERASMGDGAIATDLGEGEFERLKRAEAR